MASRCFAIVAAEFVCALLIGCTGSPPIADVMDASDGDATETGIDAIPYEAPIDVQPLDVDIDCTPDLTASSPDAGTPTFTEVYTNLFGRRCTGGVTCHGSAGFQENLVLQGNMATVYANVVGMNSVEVPGLMRVHPGQLDTSYLWLKITGCFALLPECQAPPGVCGVQMPQVSPISEGFTLAEAIPLRDWILAGAPND